MPAQGRELPYRSQENEKSYIERQIAVSGNPENDRNEATKGVPTPASVMQLTAMYCFHEGRLEWLSENDAAGGFHPYGTETEPAHRGKHRVTILKVTRCFSNG